MGQRSFVSILEQDFRSKQDAFRQPQRWCDLQSDKDVLKRHTETHPYVCARQVDASHRGTMTSQSTIATNGYYHERATDELNQGSGKDRHQAGLAPALFQ